MVDDDDMELITAKSVVTLSVVLTRTSLQDTYGPFTPSSNHGSEKEKQVPVGGGD